MFIGTPCINRTVHIHKNNIVETKRGVGDDVGYEVADKTDLFQTYKIQF